MTQNKYEIKGQGKSFIFQLDYNTKHNHIKNYEIGLESNSMILFGQDIVLQDSSDTRMENYCNFGFSYELPNGMIYQSETANKYLAGETKFKTVEIEVFRVLNI
jgi:hypothetical protein